MQSEYEIISHNNANFHIFLVSLLYRTPHFHRDFEVSLVMDGELILVSPGISLHLRKGDIFVMNPFLSHELKASAPALILSLQVSPALFASYYPRMEQTEFDAAFLSPLQEPGLCREVSDFLLGIAFAHYRQNPFHPLICASLINQLFVCLLKGCKSHLVSEKEKQISRAKARRMRNILQYMETHYAEKILLADIARQECISLYYLSHFFKECFGITFQEYITKLRCEKARQLLLLTDYSLLDISLRCGFSDVRYFNRGFRAQYGYSPREYRSSYQHARHSQQKKSMLTTQEFLSRDSGLTALEHYVSGSFQAHPQVSPSAQMFS